MRNSYRNQVNPRRKSEYIRYKPGLGTVKIIFKFASEQKPNGAVTQALSRKTNHKLQDMNVLDQVRLVIYRVNQKGLEVFLINDGKEKWTLPAGVLPEIRPAAKEHIRLDTVECQDGLQHNALAIEGDWHEIPSIREMIRQDVEIVKAEIKQRIPELEKGSFVVVKEAFKKVMPHEYAMLKELKDIIRERNSVKYI